VHSPQDCSPNDEEDKQFDGASEFFQSWPQSDVVGWPGSHPVELAKNVDEGGCWSGGRSLCGDPEAESMH
jgi:hypothetical protein